VTFRKYVSTSLGLTDLSVLADLSYTQRIMVTANSLMTDAKYRKTKMITQSFNLRDLSFPRIHSYLRLGKLLVPQQTHRLHHLPHSPQPNHPLLQYILHILPRLNLCSHRSYRNSFGILPHLHFLLHPWSRLHIPPRIPEVKPLLSILISCSNLCVVNTFNNNSSSSNNKTSNKTH
jgi:hypothetical protein